MGRRYSRFTSSNRKTEIFDSVTNNWIETVECPESMFSYTTVSSRDAVFLFGTWSFNHIDKHILRFQDDIWEKIGHLRINKRFFDPKAFTMGNKHIILHDSFGIEVWNEDFSENLVFYENSSINFAKAMFLVDREFCENYDIRKEISVLHLNQRENIDFPLMITMKGIFRF